MSRDARDAGPGRWAPGLAWLLWALTLSGLAAAFWLDQLLRRAGRPELAGRRPRHPVGWLVLVLGLSVMVDGVTDSYARYGLLASPGAVPAVRHLRTLGDTFSLWPSTRSRTRTSSPPWRPRRWRSRCPRSRPPWSAR